MCIIYIYNIFILDFKPTLNWSLRPNHFKKLTKIYFGKKKYVAYRTLNFGHKIKHSLNLIVGIFLEKVVSAFNLLQIKMKLLTLYL